MSHLRTILLATVLLTCLAAPPAQAAPEQVSIIMDDDQLLYRGDRTATRTLVTARSLGAEAVRVTVLWRVVGEGARLSNKEIERLKTDALRDKARAQRKRFKPADPRTYPTRNWDRYDTVVKEAQKLGMRVYFTITGPGPSYAHRIAPPSQRANAGTYRPYPSRFRAFVQAVGTRYNGRYRDENGIRGALPRVSLWSIWNEPNQPGWLSPQWESVDGQVVPTSPAIFRELYFAGRQGLQLSGHGGDAILLGETAPLGSPKRGPRNGIRPVPFLRELVCVAPNGAQYAGPDAAAAQVRPVRALRAAEGDGATRTIRTRRRARRRSGRACPTTSRSRTSPRSASLLDTLAAQSGGKIPAGLPILLTEFGYESNPPDPRNGIPLLRQAQFNQLAEFLAYNNPRVTATTQFLIRDAAPLTRSPTTGKAHAKGSRAVLVHVPVGPLQPEGPREAGRVRLHVPARDLQPGRPGHDRLLGAAALPPQRRRPHRRRRGLLAPDAQQQAVRPGRLDAGGRAEPDVLPRLLRGLVPDAGTRRRVLRGLPRPGEGQDHPPVADAQGLSATRATRFGGRARRPAALDLRDEPCGLALVELAAALERLVAQRVAAAVDDRQQLAARRLVRERLWVRLDVGAQDVRGRARRRARSASLCARRAKRSRRFGCASQTICVACHRSLTRLRHACRFSGVGSSCATRIALRPRR